MKVKKTKRDVFGGLFPDVLAVAESHETLPFKMETDWRFHSSPLLPPITRADAVYVSSNQPSSLIFCFVCGLWLISSHLRGGSPLPEQEGRRQESASRFRDPLDGGTSGRHYFHVCRWTESAFPPVFLGQWLLFRTERWPRRWNAALITKTSSCL